MSTQPDMSPLHLPCTHCASHRGIQGRRDSGLIGGRGGSAAGVPVEVSDAVTVLRGIVLRELPRLPRVLPSSVRVFVVVVSGLPHGDEAHVRRGQLGDPRVGERVLGLLRPNQFVVGDALPPEMSSSLR